MQDQAHNGAESCRHRNPIRIGRDHVRHLRLTFPVECSSSDVCDTLDALGFPLARKDACCVRYALLELLVNAVRASAERGTADPVVLDILCDGDCLRFNVSDSGGGFDLHSLPYDFFGNDDEIDLESESFDTYRKVHDERRFGLGLLLARRAVDEFRLCFVDANDRETPWRDDGSVCGTAITFSMKIKR